MELLSKTRKLSVHQMVAQSTAVQVYNVFKSQLPRYHHDRPFSANQENIYRMRNAANQRLEYKLCLGRGGFFYQGSRIWLALPESVRNARSVDIFKKQCKKWIQANIKTKPWWTFRNDTPVNNSYAKWRYQMKTCDSAGGRGGPEFVFLVGILLF